MRDLILDCFTFACLILPFDPLPQECDGVEFRLSMARVGVAAQIMHPKDALTWDYQCSVRTIRKWLLDNPTTPDLSWADHLPSVKLAESYYRLTKEFIDSLSLRPDLTFDERWAAGNEGERLNNVWWHIWCAKAGDNWMSRRWSLQKLRLYVGDEAFVRGLWPCPVPLKYVLDRNQSSR